MKLLRDVLPPPIQPQWSRHVTRSPNVMFTPKNELGGPAKGLLTPAPSFLSLQHAGGSSSSFSTCFGSFDCSGDAGGGADVDHLRCQVGKEEEEESQQLEEEPDAPADDDEEDEEDEEDEGDGQIE